MKDMKRAIRRHHYTRLKNKRRKMLDEWYWLDGLSEEDKNTAVCIMVNTPKRTSSCLCCGNPRKMLNELTLQEQRSMLDFEDEWGRGSKG